VCVCVWGYSTWENMCVCVGGGYCTWENMCVCVGGGLLHMSIWYVCVWGYCTWENMYVCVWGEGLLHMSIWCVCGVTAHEYFGGRVTAHGYLVWVPPAQTYASQSRLSSAFLSPFLPTILRQGL
jgi:hypothetical protein